jgi:hypothetical protein
MTNINASLIQKQKVFYPEPLAAVPWTNKKHYYLNIPFYPFRTLSTRDVAMYPKLASSEFDYSSQIFREILISILL